MDQKNCTRCQMLEKKTLKYQIKPGGEGTVANLPDFSHARHASIGSCDSKSRRRPGYCSRGAVRGMGRFWPMAAAWLRGQGGRRDQSCLPSGPPATAAIPTVSSAPMRAPPAPLWTPAAAGAVGELSTIGVTSKHGDLSRLQCAYERSTCSSSDTSGGGIGGGIRRSFASDLAENDGVPA
jgi:hypothetical protein